MIEFVEECRREWQRLGVSGGIADEMAAELGDDLAEAESLEDAVGAAAADPRSFAREWASERGVLPRRSMVRIAAVLAALGLIPAIAGAVLLVQAAGSKEDRAAVPPETPRTWVVAVPAAQRARVADAEARVAQAQAVLFERGARATATDARGTDDGRRTAGIVLLASGLAAFLPATLLQLRRRDLTV